MGDDSDRVQGGVLAGRPVKAGSGSSGRTRLLAVSPAPLWPTNNGYSLRVVNLLEELSLTWDLVVVAAASAPEDDRTSSLDLHTYIPVEVRRSISSLPWGYETGPLRVASVHAAETCDPSAVLLWPGIEFFASDLGIPAAVGDRIDCVVLHYLREVRTAASLRARLRSLENAFRSARYERKILRELAAMMAVGEADARLLQWLSPGHPVHVVPNGVRLGAPPDPSTESDDPTVVFTGALGFRPNLEAAHFFASDVFPAVRAQVPDARFLIVGKKGGEGIRSLADVEGVEIHTDVPDMGKVLREAWVSVAVMRSGGGIKNKVLEAWSAGTPVVMNSLATNGLAPGFEDGSLVADEPQAIADSVARLLKDPAERLHRGQAGHDFVRRHHSWSQAAEVVTRLLRSAQVSQGVPKHD